MWRSNCVIAWRAAGAVTSLAFRTTSMLDVSLGNAARRRSNVCTTGRSLGSESVPGWPVCSCNAGIASATSRPPEIVADSHG